MVEMKKLLAYARTEDSFILDLKYTEVLLIHGITVLLGVELKSNVKKAWMKN